MLHHIDIHAIDPTGPKRLLDAIADVIGYVPRTGDDADFAGYVAANGRRPNLGIIADLDHRAGSMQIAFGVQSNAKVDEAGRRALEAGARAIEGPAFHPEYGDDYYAVFFEDDQGNKYEVCADPSL